MTLTPGATLGPYTIRAELGAGGMGVCYTAQDPRLDRQVAIKLLPPDLTRDETAKQRFLREAQDLMVDLRSEGLLTPEPFDEAIEFLYFDYWHYFGRTAKHGAFMGGADFVQWHGNYELLLKLTELKEMADALRVTGDRE